ncbi:hypothetical protein NQ314_007249 [Rhamnusium bicolor]|uniref:Peroxisome assembly protein 12 n=1 Tax=Rhamnusium bicolor TaxID=1586634 RepID=A0AAV8YSK7_9CUCU|nr:hypothetical protein NQ314_007249 [Rhamnusium bicolor]
MAENAANFTFTYQNKPSIFEIIAQKSLNDTLHPALQKIALFLANNFPQKFNWLNKYYEETFLVLNGFLQYHYLKYYDASFSENFYGLKRVLVSNEQLTKHHKELSLIFLVVLPYFRRKMEEKLAVIRIENAEGYLTKKKKMVYDKTIIISNQFKNDFFSLSELSFGLVRNAATTFLEATAFFLQFLHTWNAQKSNYSMTDLPNVPPPPLDNRAKTYQGKCPICLKPWLIPTVLPASGYIFCFRCILRYLSENHRCPVTHLPAKPLDIIRLYI